MASKVCGARGGVSRCPSNSPAVLGSPLRCCSTRFCRCLPWPPTPAAAEADRTPAALLAAPPSELLMGVEAMQAAFWEGSAAGRAMLHGLQHAPFERSEASARAVQTAPYGNRCGQAGRAGEEFSVWQQLGQRLGWLLPALRYFHPATRPLIHAYAPPPTALPLMQRQGAAAGGGAPPVPAQPPNEGILHCAHRADVGGRPGLGRGAAWLWEVLAGSSVPD